MLLRPVDPKTLMELSNLLVDVSESRQAVACLKRLVNIEPHNVSAWQNLAVAQFTRRRYFEGIASSQAALRLQPNSPQVLYNLALAYSHMHQFDLALSHVRRGLDFSPRDLALQKLELRLRVLRLKARITDFFRGILGGD
jgi:tetratricopeptide (TPR) repeat protein